MSGTIEMTGTNREMRMGVYEAGVGRSGRAWMLALALAVSVMPAVRPSSAVAQEPADPDASRVLTLREAVATSLEGNQQLEDARHTLAAAQAQAREAWGNVMPRANFSMNYTRNLERQQFFLPAIIFDPSASPDDVVAVPAGSENSWFAQARVDQPIFDGQAFIGVGAASRFEALQQEVLRGRAQRVATSTRLGYYSVLLAQEQVRLTTNSFERVEQVLEETKKLNRAGLASDYDVVRLEVELANIEPNVRRSENGLESARRALAVEMGVETLRGMELAGSLLTLELPALPGLDPVATLADAPESGDPTDLLLDRGAPAEALPADELLETAQARRSDLEQLRMTRDLRATERKAELSNYLPKVSLFGTWTQQAQHDGSPDFFGGNSFETQAIGVQVDIPLFSGFQRPARLSRMTSVVNQIDAQLAYAREQAANEVVTLGDEAREAHERAAAQRRAVRHAIRGFEIARSEYSAGMGSQLQVTDAELALRQSEFNYAQAVYDYLTAQARLDAAIGVVPLVDTGDAVALQRQAGDR